MGAVPGGPLRMGRRAAGRHGRRQLRHRSSLRGSLTSFARRCGAALALWSAPISRVLTERGNRARYPDLAITCAPIRAADAELPEPLLIVEVMSETTAATDRGAKRAEYAALPSLRRYVMLAQDEPLALVCDRAHGFEEARYGTPWSFRNLGFLSRWLGSTPDWSMRALSRPLAVPSASGGKLRDQRGLCREEANDARDDAKPRMGPERACRLRVMRGMAEK